MGSEFRAAPQTVAGPPLLEASGKDVGAARISDADRAEIVQLTRELVEIPSATKDLVANEQCLRYIEEYLKDTDWVLTRFQKAPGMSPALYIAPTPHTRHTKLLFLGHADVVPARTYSVTGDFEGKISGRGVSDMKGPLAVLLHILKRTSPVTHDLAMLVATDEEIGGFDGAKFCFADAEGPHITCDVCHCPDGGDGFKIVTHEKGVLRLKLIADGHNAHSAYPWHGKNAIQHLMHDLKALENATDAQGRRVFDNRELDWHSTMNVSFIEGGEAINQVPKSASAQVDIRFTEDWNIERLKELVLRTVTDCDVEFFFEQNMLLCPPDLQYVKDAEAAIKGHTGQATVQYSRGHGTSDGHWASFPTVMFKPFGGGLHQDGEWLDFPSLLTYGAIAQDLTRLWSEKK